jgi:hypothetical protein
MSVPPVKPHVVTTIVSSPTVRPAATAPAPGDNDGDADGAKGNDPVRDKVTISEEAQAKYLAQQSNGRNVI